MGVITFRRVSGLFGSNDAIQVECVAIVYSGATGNRSVGNPCADWVPLAK